MRVRIDIDRSGPSDIGAVITGLAERVELLPAALAQRAGEVGGPAILAGAKAKRGSLTMSNNKKLRGELDCTVIVRDGGKAKGEVEFVATPMGPWFLAEFGGKAPEKPITPKRRYGKRKALDIDGLYRASARHPGAGPSPGWNAGVRAAEPDIRKAVEALIDEAVKAP